MKVEVSIKKRILDRVDRRHFLLRQFTSQGSQMAEANNAHLTDE